MTYVTTSLAHQRSQHAGEAGDGPQPADSPSATTESAGDVVDIEDAQSTVNEICGRRYKLNRVLTESGRTSGGPQWHAFHARDEFLGRSVVVRMATARNESEVASVSKLVDRARVMASINEHLISRTYDAVVQDSVAPADSDPHDDADRTFALIVSSYFDGPTLGDLIADHAAIDTDPLLDSLHGRLRALDQSNLSLGVLQPDQIVITEDGPAIAAPAIGLVDEIGATDLTGVCDSLGVDPSERARIDAPAATDDEAKGPMRDTERGDPADTDPIERYREEQSPLGDEFYDDPVGDTGDDGHDGNGGDMGEGQDEPKRNKLVLAVAVLLSLCALLVIGWFVGLLIGGLFSTGSNHSPQAADESSSASSQPSSSAAKPQTGQPIAVVGAKLLDPPPGDGKENPDRINLSYDGNTGTTWPTLQYKGSANFGNLKPGVGIVYDLGSEQTVGSVKITTTLPGAMVEIRTGTEAQAGSLDAYPVVVPDTQLTGETTITLPEGTKTRYVVVWITKLVPQENYYQASLSEVAFTS